MKKNNIKYDKITPITCRLNAYDMTRIMLDSVVKTTNFDYIDDFIIFDDGSDDGKNKDIVEEFNFITLAERDYSVGKQGGSFRHGMALDKVFEKFDLRNKLVLVFDFDIIFFVKNWNNVILNEINNNCDVFGSRTIMSTGYVGDNENAPEFSTNQHSSDIFCCFPANIIYDNKLSFLPKNVDMGQDDFWEIADYMKNNRFKSLLMPFINTRLHQGKVFDKGINVGEYNYKDRPFIAHYARGSMRTFKKEYVNSTQKWYEASKNLDKYIIEY